MRARYPDREGYVESHGVPIFWEQYGEGDRTGYDHDRCAADALAVLDATATARASLIAHSRSTSYAAILAAEHPERVERLVLIGSSLGAGPRVPSSRPGSPIARGCGPGWASALTRRFVPDPYSHLAACDLAVVQGGLSTCMELTATKRPFLYFPLRNHFEQDIHVPHRLARYGAGVRMDYHQTDPESLVLAIADGLKCPILYRDVETDGARRAAQIIAGSL